jgi:hypothetical protein
LLDDVTAELLAEAGLAAVPQRQESY